MVNARKSFLITERSLKVENKAHLAGNPAAEGAGYVIDKKKFQTFSLYSI